MLKSMSFLRACAIGAALLAVPQVAKAQDPVNLTIASFAQGSSWYVYGVNLGEILREALPEGSTVDTPPIAGGTGNPPLVAAGKADLALGIAVVNTWALKGVHAFEEPLENLRALVGGWDQYYLLPVTRGDNTSDLEAYFEENPQAQVVLLPRGSLGSLGGQQILQIAGASEEKLAESGGGYEFGSFDMVKSRFASGSADVFVQVVTVGHPAITEMAQAQTLTFMQPSDEVLREMTERYGWETAILPAGTFPGQDNDVELPGSTTMLFTTEEFSDDLAYTTVKTICEETDKLRAAHEALRNFDCETGRVWEPEVNGIPLHAGAERYYREQGWID